jgi:hypothetical protein
MGRWRIAIGVAVAVWIVLMVRLMIADVWDETNGLLFFADPTHTFGDLVTFTLTKSLGFWRPIPTLIAATVMHILPFDVSWRVLRGVNMVLLLGAVFFLIRTVDAWTGSNPARSFVLTIALLFSGSAVITAGWYANIFDATSLFLIALALFLMTRRQFVLAGIAIGAGFFCKETTALALAFLVPLVATRRVRLRDAAVVAIPAVALGLAYFVLRGRIIAFGSTGDVHGFDVQQYVPSALGFLESFWRETLKAGKPTVLGFCAMLFSLAALRKPVVIAAAVVFLAACTIIYWGMFAQYQDGLLVSHHDFAGRLYLVPVSLMITLLALERRTLALAILLVLIVSGGITTYRDHARFQRAYRRIYRIAKPVTIYFPEKPLHDPARGIEIGDLPNATFTLDARTGRLLPRR